MLEIDDLHVNYAHVEAVRGVGLTVRPGRVTLVLGANGAGKTTTLKAVAGIQAPHRGRVTLDGENITGLPAHAIVGRGIALVPEGRRVFAPLSVAENLRLGGYTAKKGQYEDTLARVYEMFPILSERRAGAAGLLSGGEQQMLAFGRALMSQPKVMLMDEPSMGLAPVLVDVVLQKVRAMADGGLGILMVEQNAEAGLDVADDVVAIDWSQIGLSGITHDLDLQADVLRAFLGEAALAS